MAIVVVAAVALIVGGPWVLSAVAGPSPAGPAAFGPTGSPGQSIVVPPSTPSVPADGSGSAPGRSASPRPSPAVPILAISGGGDHPASKLLIGGGTYQVDYVVTSPPGESCPWAMFLTDARGLDLLMASAYPADETVRASARDAGVVGGAATVRVESGCPRWSATVTRLGP